ncbi:MAG TPA: hypothetical protein VKG38_08845 [Solirubrobacteraceae bacterium]|nr:hypothetical protein [Solirubrobacteraceae bacterium]
MDGTPQSSQAPPAASARDLLALFKQPMTAGLKGTFGKIIERQAKHG